MNNQIVANHTLILYDVMYKWNGKNFHVYEKNKKTTAYELTATCEQPIIKRIGCHNIRLYNNGNVGFRILVHSEYLNRPDYVEFPIMYDNGDIAWDNPLLIPNSVKKQTFAIMRTMRQLEIL